MANVELSLVEEYPRFYIGRVDGTSTLGDVCDIPDDLITAHMAAEKGLRSARQAIARHLIDTGQLGDRSELIHQMQ